MYICCIFKLFNIKNISNIYLDNYLYISLFRYIIWFIIFFASSSPAARGVKHVLIIRSIPMFGTTSLG